MKYFTHAKMDGSEEILGNASAAKRYLKAHPEVATVTRYWWSGNDLIDVEEFTRERLLVTTARELSRGATAQWAATHPMSNPGRAEKENTFGLDAPRAGRYSRPATMTDNQQPTQKG